MSPSFDAPDSPAPLFGRRRETTPAATYWKCQIGRRIHLARENAARKAKACRQDFGRDAFARQIGIAPRRLWEIENGILSLDASEIAIIADALDLHPGSLFDDLNFDYWATATDARFPPWILAKTIGQLPGEDRELLEQLVVRLDARSMALSA